MSELLLSAATTTDHHYVFPAGLEASVDIEVAVAQRLVMGVLLTRGSMNRSVNDGGLPPDRWCRTRTRSWLIASAWWRHSTSAARTPWCRSH